MLPITAVGQSAPPAAGAPAAGSAARIFTIDPVHSGLKFEVEHLLVSSVSGRFNTFQGMIQLDPANPGSSNVQVKIDASSINTEWNARDNDLRSANFFDVAKFPELTFKSTAVAQTAPGQLAVTGDFTMHGVTRSITIPVSQKGPVDGPKPGVQVVGFKGTVTIKRSDFGMTRMVGPIGDEVAITLNVEADANSAN
jgi:polyisoprenoid-binding protein YceI